MTINISIKILFRYASWENVQLWYRSTMLLNGARHIFYQLTVINSLCLYLNGTVRNVIELNFPIAIRGYWTVSLIKKLEAEKRIEGGGWNFVLLLMGLCWETLDKWSYNDPVRMCCESFWCFIIQSSVFPRFSFHLCVRHCQRSV